MAAPIRDLDSLSPVLLDEEARTVAFAALPTEERLLAEQLVHCIEGLVAGTGWEPQILLRRFGCRLKSVSDVAAMGTARLEDCLAFLRVVATVAGLAGPSAQQRHVVEMCADLVQDARDGDLLRMLQTSVEGWSAIEYVRLGEVARASRFVRMATSEPEDEVDIAAHPFASVGAVHISTPRIDAYLREDTAALGEEVRDRIEFHLGNCQPCHEAVDERRRQLSTSGA